MNISASSGHLPNKPSSKSQTNGKGADTKSNQQKQPTTPHNVDPKKAAQIGHAHRYGLTITPAEIPVSPGTELRNLVVVPNTGETLSKVDRSYNRSLRHFADILDKGGNLNVQQNTRLAEITQRRTPPTVETPQLEQEAVGYADALYSGAQSGFGLLSSGVKALAGLDSYQNALSLSSIGFSLAIVAADQFHVTRNLPTVLSVAAGFSTVGSGLILLAQEGDNYLKGKEVNPWNLGNSIAQTLSGAGTLTGSSAVRSASLFTSTGLHAAKTLQTGALDHAGSAIVGALSLAVGGDKVALANTVLIYGNLVQTGIAVWTKLDGDSTQQAEVKALKKLIEIIDTPVSTDAKADAVTAKAVAFLKSSAVANLPKSSELGTLFHSLKNLPETATNTLGLLLAPLASLGKPSSSNLGTYLAVSLLGLNLLPGANAQESVDETLANVQLMTARLNVTLEQVEAKLVELDGTIVDQKELIASLILTLEQFIKKLQEVTYLAGNQTVALEETKQELQKVTSLAGNQTVALEQTNLALEQANKKLQEVTDLAGNQTVAIAQSDAKIDASNKAITENAADNQYTRDVSFRLAGVGVAAIGIIVLAYTIKHCFFKTSQDTPAAKIGYANTKDTLIERNDAKIVTAKTTLDTLQDRWDVRNALHTQVTQPFISGAAASPEKPESLGQLRDDLAELARIEDMTAKTMTGKSLVSLNDIIEELPQRKEAAEIATTVLIEAIKDKSDAARATIAANQENLQRRPPYIELQEFRRLGLGVDQSADACIQQVLNPGDLGYYEKPEELTVAQVTAMQTALSAQASVDATIGVETNAIKAAARGLFEAETTRMRWLTPAMTNSLEKEITAFTKAVANILEIEPKSFGAALQARQELRTALVDTLNENVEYVTGARDDVRENITTLNDFRALGLPVELTAEQTLVDLGNNDLLPSAPITDENLHTLGEVAYTNLARAIAAADGVDTAIDIEKAAIIQHVRDSVAAQQQFNDTIPKIEDLKLATLADFTRTSAALNDLEDEVPNPVPFGEAIAARTALRGEIITYVNGSRQAITRILDTTNADRTELAGLLDLAERFTGDEGQPAAGGGDALSEGPSAVVTVPLRKTDTQNSLNLLQFAITQIAEVTEDTLDLVTEAQFAALNAAVTVTCATFAETIAGETGAIKDALVAKLETERQRIATLHPKLRERLATELGKFATESENISDDDATHTLANFTTVFAAIDAVDTATARERERAAVKIQRVRRQHIASRAAKEALKSADQARLSLDASPSIIPSQNSDEVAINIQNAEVDATAQNDQAPNSQNPLIFTSDGAAEEKGEEELHRDPDAVVINIQQAGAAAQNH
jgi:hypothetical protein